MKDDVPEEVKKERLREIADLFYSTAAQRNKRFIGTQQVVLVDKASFSYLFCHMPKLCDDC